MFMVYNKIKKIKQGGNQMNKIKNFLLFAEHLTGTPKEQIKVIEMEIDQDTGLFSGLIEIDGYTEYIHEYHN